jgi:drug/metabolite transporter (DMT)-like permease
MGSLPSSKQLQLNAVTSPIRKGGITAALLSSFGWSMTGIWVRHIPTVTAAQLTAARLIIAGVLSLVALALLRKRILRLSTVKSPVTWILGGLLGLYYLLAVSAFQGAPVGQIALIISASPLFAIGFDYWCGATVRRTDFFGVCLALVGLGIALSESYSKMRSPNYHWVAYLYALGASFTTSAFAFVSHEAESRKIGAKGAEIVIVTTLLGFLLLPVGDGLGNYCSLSNVIPMIGLSLISTAIPSFSFSYATKRLAPVLTTTVRLSTPIMATFFAWLFLNEAPSWLFFIGATICLAGIAVVILIPTVKKQEEFS